MVIAISIGVANPVFRTWIQQYQFHGEKAFEKCYTSYTLQYKPDVLKYMNEQGTSIRETAAIFNILASSTLFQRLLETHGILETYDDDEVIIKFILSEILGAFSERKRYLNLSVSIKDVLVV